MYNSWSFLPCTSYAASSVFRAWVSKEEGKITRRSFIVYVVSFGYVVFSFIFFSIIFAVSPDPKVRYPRSILLLLLLAGGYKIFCWKCVEMNISPKYATTPYHSYKCYEIPYITGRNKEHFLVCGRVTSKKILTRAVYRKQSYIFGLYEIFPKTIQPLLQFPETMIIHTVPYTNLCVGLFVLAVIVTWFGEKVAWDGLGIPLWLHYVNRVTVALQVR